MYQVCYARYQVSFYLWWFRPELNYSKVPKYYDQDCLKIFFYSLHFQWRFNFLEKVPISAENVSSLKKQLLGKVERFLKSHFDLNQGYRIVLTQNLELLTELTCFVFLLWLEKCLEVTENIKNSIVKETGSSYEQKRVCSDNPGQNIWHIAKKYSKTG